jgi:hypothetical protein
MFMNSKHIDWRSSRSVYTENDFFLTLRKIFHSRLSPLHLTSFRRSSVYSNSVSAVWLGQTCLIYTSERSLQFK